MPKNRDMNIFCVDVQLTFRQYHTIANWKIFDKHPDVIWYNYITIGM